MIIGPGGAGKTTVANELAKRTGLPVVHLDRIFWREGWAPAPRDQAERELARAVQGERWILDGNFLESPGGRFERADTVVFLDLPRRLCIWRVLSRRVHDRGGSRPDLPAAEGFDADLLRWIWRYSAVDRPRVLELLSGLPEDVKVHSLRRRPDVRAFLGTLTLALALFLVAAFGSAAGGSVATKTVVRGKVVLFPASPVCRVGSSCTKPLPGFKLVFRRNGRIAARVTTDANARYRVVLAAGRYAVRTPRRGALKPDRIRIPAAKRATVNFRFDAGIR